MNIYVNGELKFIKSKTIKDLLDELDINSEFIAIALDENFVPKSEYKQTILNTDCRIEIVSPNQGG